MGTFFNKIFRELRKSFFLTIFLLKKVFLKFGGETHLARALQSFSKIPDFVGFPFQEDQPVPSKSPT